MELRCPVPAKHSQGTAGTPVILDEVWSWRKPTLHSDQQMDDQPAATHVPAVLQTYIKHVLYLVKQREKFNEHSNKFTDGRQVFFCTQFSSQNDFLSPIHTADADETKLSSLVASASAVCT